MTILLIQALWGLQSAGMATKPSCVFPCLHVSLSFLSPVLLSWPLFQPLKATQGNYLMKKCVCAVNIKNKLKLKKKISMSTSLWYCRFVLFASEKLWCQVWTESFPPTESDELKHKANCLPNSSEKHSIHRKFKSAVFLFFLFFCFFHAFAIILSEASHASSLLMEWNLRAV